MSRRSASPRARLVAAATVVVALAVASGTSDAHPGHTDEDPLLGDSTLEHTIRGEDQQHVNDGRGDPGSFALLRLGPGEPYVVRDELGEARPNRGNRRRSLIYLGHLTDMQLADQQSPGRVEFVDPFGVFPSAWRPQETLVPHQTELSIRQMNRFLDSPVPQGNGDRARLANAVMTGDLADNQQLNETRWVAQLLQGGVFVDGTRVDEQVDPNSGSSDVDEYPPECQAAVVGGQLDPDDADRYVGVQNYDDYPGGSTLADRHNFYDPNQPQGPSFGNWPRYEGLMDKAQEPFVAEGLRVPSYVAFGNHDGLAQGHQWANATFDRIARGCVKVFPAPGALDFLADLGIDISSIVGLRHRRLMEEALGMASDPSPQQVEQQQDSVLESFETLVPPDDDRRFIDRREFMQIFDNGFQEDAHGFAFVDEDEHEASDGAASYYDFSPADGIRYIVLDTVSYGGQFPLSSSGNISHPQFLWLERKLEEARDRNELVLVFGHHGIGSLTSPVPHENAAPCRDPATGEDQQAIVGPGCDRDPRDSRKPGEPSPHQGEDLMELLHQFPNAIALIAGHSHDNKITPYPNEDGDGPGFWEIKSPAIVDWPAQHRLIELMDNRDGTLSIFATMLDDASQPKSPTPADDAGRGARGTPRFEFDRSEVEDFTPRDLASVGRTLSYNDPQVGPEGWDEGPPQGTEIDRNVELLIGDPRRDEPDPGAPDDRDPDRDRDRGEPERAGPTAAPDADRAPAAETVDRRGSLPFTGLAVLLLLLIAAGLLAGGRLARHLARRGG